MLTVKQACWPSFQNKLTISQLIKCEVFEKKKKRSKTRIVALQFHSRFPGLKGRGHGLVDSLSTLQRRRVEFQITAPTSIFCIRKNYLSTDIWNFDYLLR
jgi:hypothetical protein